MHSWDHVEMTRRFCLFPPEREDEFVKKKKKAINQPTKQKTLHVTSSQKILQTTRDMQEDKLPVKSILPSRMDWL